jgi:hypothetical protein
MHGFEYYEHKYLDLFVKRTSVSRAIPPRTDDTANALGSNAHTSSCELNATFDVGDRKPVIEAEYIL